jgi:hypothetical protein
LWFLLPSLNARRFLVALKAEDYRSADRLFSKTEDRFLAEWAEKRWSFRSSGELIPFTFDQLWHNRRELRVETTYFEFDQYFSVETYLAITPFGASTLERLPAHRLGIVTPGRADAVPIR